MQSKSDQYLTSISLILNNNSDRYLGISVVADLSYCISRTFEKKIMSLKKRKGWRKQEKRIQTRGKEEKREKLDTLEYKKAGS